MRGMLWTGEKCADQGDGQRVMRAVLIVAAGFRRWSQMDKEDQGPPD